MMVVASGVLWTDMRLGIDASNIRAGGGVTHLVELLRAAEPIQHGFEQVIVWGGLETLQCIEDRPWLRKIHDPLLDRALPFRLYWQRFLLNKLAHSVGCNVLFVPGGTYRGDFRPFVTMSQNLLPFEWAEARRYGMSWMLLKFLLLRQSQTKTFQRAQGTIFLTKYASDVVLQITKPLNGMTAIIPHGVNDEFDCPPRGFGMYSVHKPARILYVSTVTVYKHQWHVAEAVAMLRKKGFPVQLELIGSAYPPALKRFRQTLQHLDPAEEFIRYRGSIPYTDLHQEYKNADFFVFASSCENLPNILLEAMKAGLPIACAKRGPMPEVLGDAGVYFDPEKSGEIASAIQELLDDADLRQQNACKAYNHVQNFTWDQCAHDTLSFIAQVFENKSPIKSNPNENHRLGG